MEVCANGADEEEMQARRASDSHSVEILTASGREEQLAPFVGSP